MREKSLLDGIGREDCISVSGPIEARDEETYNPKIPTGTIELGCKSVRILGKVKRPLPFEVLTSKETREDIRLKYRFLDMRNRKVKENIVFPRKGDIVFAQSDGANGFSGSADAHTVRVLARGRKGLYRPLAQV